ncbi:MAG: pyridoxal phosphate-dependent aminotransferase [Pseudomonadota bacterium]|nr:pyridoxal phosphate-dependent aminotransferase [Pseudomonadota bacterium]
MDVSEVTRNLSSLGGAKWDMHVRARALAAAGHPIIELTIGEPDEPMAPVLVPAMAQALQAGRVGYSNGRGEAALLDALAARYTARRGRVFTTDNFLAFPGTQTALYALMRGLVNPGDEVVVFDPCYATYEGVVAGAGATMVSAPLDPDTGFSIDFDALEAVLTPRTRAILLNNPHNPAGSLLDEGACMRLGDLAVQRGLWLICDEVYEDLIYDNRPMVSPLNHAAFDGHALGCASISKSHAAPGLRSGWVVGAETVIEQLVPLAETMLFGNQPFIADATAAALGDSGETAARMRESLRRRAKLVTEALDGVAGLRVAEPQAGMFALVGVGGTGLGLDGHAFAARLLEQAGVAVMPGTSFGAVTRDWIRLSLTVPDEVLQRACDRIAALCA